MKVYFCGICGTGLGALALMAKDAGMEVCGSDLAAGAVTPELAAAGIRVKLGAQDGQYMLEENKQGRIDWVVRSSAVPETAPEVFVAKQLGIRVTKRDEFIAWLAEEKNLKMVAVAGTHGKTTTSAAMVWACLNLGVPVSWLVGTTLGFAGAGKYSPGSSYLIYEADEYDRNFLAFHPWLSVITAVSYDHPDIYPTVEDYVAAFQQFAAQSREVIEEAAIDPRLTVAGDVRRYDLSLALAAMLKIGEDMGRPLNYGKLLEVLDEFPGVGRRFEKIAEGMFSDYAHHPDEVAATIQIAKEEAERKGLKGVVAVYEPHQNTRQHRIREAYREVFEGAARVFWLPTYLTREDPALPVIKPEEFIANLSNVAAAQAEPARLTGDFAARLRDLRDEGYLILLMTAGPADTWFRQMFGTTTS